MTPQERRDSNLARAKLRKAILAGRIQKGPCAICGSSYRPTPTWKDFRFPLDPMWLCRICYDRKKFRSGCIFLAMDADPALIDQAIKFNQNYQSQTQEYNDAESTDCGGSD